MLPGDWEESVYPSMNYQYWHGPLRMRESHITQEWVWVAEKVIEHIQNKEGMVIVVKTLSFTKHLTITC